MLGSFPSVMDEAQRSLPICLGSHSKPAELGLEPRPPGGSPEFWSLAVGSGRNADLRSYRRGQRCSGEWWGVLFFLDTWPEVLARPSLFSRIVLPQIKQVLKSNLALPILPYGMVTEPQG